MKHYSLTNDEAEILVEQVFQRNAIRSVLFNRKASYRTVNSDSFDYATKEDDITANNIIHNETGDNLSRRETTTNFTTNKHEINDMTTFIENLMT